MFQVNNRGKLILTDELGELLTRIQRQGNTDVTYRTDQQIYGVAEKWAYPKAAGPKLVGDCEDIALYKRNLLLEAGVPGGPLLLTICRDPAQSGHCVLCVVTEDKDFILCNSHTTLATPKMMIREGYRFLFRQQLGRGVDEPWDILA